MYNDKRKAAITSFVLLVQLHSDPQVVSRLHLLDVMLTVIVCLSQETLQNDPQGC